MWKDNLIEGSMIFLMSLLIFANIENKILKCKDGGLQPKKPETTANFKFATGFFRLFGLQPPPPQVLTRDSQCGLLPNGHKIV